MSDQLDQDIEDVLSKIDDFEWHRRQRQGQSRLRRAWNRRWDALTQSTASLLVRFTPGHLMLLGFLVLVGALVFRFRGLGTWLVLVGVVLFALGLLWSMRGGGGGGTARGGYWRDRYISYQNEPSRGLRGWFRRRR